MNKIQIMILGENEQDIIPIINQLDSTTEWQVNAFSDKEEAVNYFQQGLQDVVIFSEAMKPETKQGLSKLFRFQEKDIVLLTTKANSNVWEEVNDALHQKAIHSRPTYAIVDDALKNARFNICLN
jgi:predicted oxidoreductase (fatty acid repression mutant protein)